MQGDVLQRSEKLNEVLKEVHPHFSDAKNRFFMVLTQSCDLVPRQGGACKAPYVTLASVRSLDLVLTRYLNKQSKLKVKSDLPVMDVKTKDRAAEFLRKLFNNNEPGYFFLDSKGTELGSDCVALLNLSIAVKAELHLQTLREAKVLQLESTFQAKLGWLVGQMYSRVGTPDWESSSIENKIEETLKDAACWVPEETVKLLEKDFKIKKQQDASYKVPQDDIVQFISSCPSKKDLFLKQINKILSEALPHGSDSLLDKINNRLRNNPELSALFKRI